MKAPLADTSLDGVLKRLAEGAPDEAESLCGCPLPPGNWQMGHHHIRREEDGSWSAYEPCEAIHEMLDKWLKLRELMLEAQRSGENTLRWKAQTKAKAIERQLRDLGVRPDYQPAPKDKKGK